MNFTFKGTVRLFQETLRANSALPDFQQYPDVVWSSMIYKSLFIILKTDFFLSRFLYISTAGEHIEVISIKYF